MNNYVITVMSELLFARASVTIKCNDSITAEEIALKSFKDGDINNWYLLGYKLQDEIISRVFVSRVDKIEDKTFSVTLETDKYTAYAVLEVSAENESKALEIFQSADLKNSWIWNDIPLYDYNLTVINQYILNATPKVPVSISVSGFVDPKVGISSMGTVTITTNYEGNIFNAKGYVKLNNGPSVPLVSGMANLTFIPEKSGSQDIAISYIPEPDNLFQYLPSIKYYNVNILKGDNMITINANKNNVNKDEWITLSLSSNVNIPFTVDVASYQGMTRRLLETRLINENPEIIMVRYSSSITWNMNQTLKCEFKGNLDYSASSSNSLAITVV